MEFLEKNFKNVLGGLAFVVIVALLATLISQNSMKREQEAQEKYYSIEALVKKYREEKTLKSETDKKTVSAPVDVAALKSDLQAFVKTQAGTVAAQMAALDLVSLQAETNSLNTSEAIDTLKSVETKTELLTNTLVRMKLAQLYVEQDKCSEAVTVWSKVLESKQAGFAHSEARINQALCYQKMDNTAKAEELLNQVKNDKAEGSIEMSKEAEKLLRLIQFKKSFGS